MKMSVNTLRATTTFITQHSSDNCLAMNEINKLKNVNYN